MPNTASVKPIGNVSRSLSPALLFTLQQAFSLGKLLPGHGQLQFQCQHLCFVTNATCFDLVHEPCLSEPQAGLYFMCVHMHVYNVYMNLYILSIKSSLL